MPIVLNPPPKEYKWSPYQRSLHRMRMALYVQENPDYRERKRQYNKEYAEKGREDKDWRRRNRLSSMIYYQNPFSEHARMEYKKRIKADPVRREKDLKAQRERQRRYAARKKAKELRWKTLLEKLATVKRKHDAPLPDLEDIRWEECIERHKKYKAIG